MPYRPGGFQGPFDIGTLLEVVLVALVVVLGTIFVFGSPTALTITMLVLGALGVLAMGHMLLTVMRARCAAWWGPTRTVRAVVARKWPDQHEYGVPLGGQITQVLADSLDRDAVPTLHTRWNFWVSFDLGQGREEEFQVPEGVYAQLEEDTEGILTYRGERLLRFLPSEKAPESGPRVGDNQRPNQQ